MDSGRQARSWYNKRTRQLKLNAWRALRVNYAINYAFFTNDDHASSFQRSFEWFVNLLSQLEIEQAELGGAMERFLDMHMYITSALQKTDMKAVGLQLALDLLHKKVQKSFWNITRTSLFKFGLVYCSLVK